MMGRDARPRGSAAGPLQQPSRLRELSAHQLFSTTDSSSVAVAFSYVLSPLLQAHSLFCMCFSLTHEDMQPPRLVQDLPLGSAAALSSQILWATDLKGPILPGQGTAWRKLALLPAGLGLNAELCLSQLSFIGTEGICGK